MQNVVSSRGDHLLQMSALRSGVRGGQHANNEGDTMIQTAPTLGSGNLHDVVRLPNGEDLNEWLAVNSK